MALYKDYLVDRHQITVNTEGFRIITQSSGALWMSGDEGQVMKLSFNEDGNPVTQVSFKNEDGTRNSLECDWDEVVNRKEDSRYVTVDVTGDSWAVSIVEETIKQIQTATKDGRIVFQG